MAALYNRRRALKCILFKLAASQRALDSENGHSSGELGSTFHTATAKELSKRVSIEKGSSLHDNLFSSLFGLWEIPCHLR